MTSAPVQRKLALDISGEVSLLSLKTVAAALGCHIDRATEQADEWPFVFDLSAGRRIVSERRVWKAHVTGERTLWVKDEDLAEVLVDVIGTADGNVRGAYLETRWDVSNKTLKRLKDAGEFSGRIAGHALWIERASLAAFLERRLVR